MRKGAKRVMRRRGRRMNRRSNKYGGVKLYKETTQDLPLVIRSSTNILKYSCALNDIDNSHIPPGATVTPFAAYRSLYGRYCIVGMKLKFVPRFTVAAAGGTSALRVSYAVNKDPNFDPSSEIDIVRQVDAKMTNTNRGFTVYVKHPVPVMYINSGDVANNNIAQAPVPSQANQASLYNDKWNWLPTRSENQFDPSGSIFISERFPAHVGVDLCVTDPSFVTGTTTPYTVYDVFKTVYYAFKHE